VAHVCPLGMVQVHGPRTIASMISHKLRAIGMISANVPLVSCSQWPHGSTKFHADMRDIRNGSPRQFVMEKRRLKNAVDAHALDHSNFLLAVRISNLVEIFICRSQEGRSNARMALL
jgi:hypothetical protein